MPHLEKTSSHKYWSVKWGLETDISRPDRGLLMGDPNYYQLSRSNMNTAF
jgi:hypothetical protein